MGDGSVNLDYIFNVANALEIFTHLKLKKKVLSYIK